ncbi:MAG: hypothetical protein FWG73_04105 [Planctomycetaceae bacterium]|nr:hypothetical protein [Planctomycetaceae bacterium]
MVPIRNLILLVFLSIFLLWYAASWAYRTQYTEPRQTLQSEMTRLSSEIEVWQNNLNMMTQFNAQYAWLFQRSLPPVSNDAQSWYSFWLLEVLQHSGFENPQVNAGPVSRITPGANYRFNAQYTGSLSQFSYFLFEFYYAPFLHRITSLTLLPTEGNTEILTFTMTVNVLALDSRFNPSTVQNSFPTVPIPRLAFNNLEAYQVIEERNLLQVARGGIDRADHTTLTAILEVGDQVELWFRDGTAGRAALPIKKRLGETIQAGSFTGRIVDIYLQEELVVLDRDGTRWLLAAGESLNEAFALPPEAFLE